MRNAVALGASLWLASGIAQAQQPRSPYEQVVVELLGALGQMNKALDKVIDGPSAEAARPAVKDGVARFLKARQQAEKLKQPDLAERLRVIEAYQKKLADAVDSLQFQVRRIRAMPSARPILQELEPLEPAPPKEKEKPKS
jgi:hypothetical protein